MKLWRHVLAISLLVPVGLSVGCGKKSSKKDATATNEALSTPVNSLNLVLDSMKSASAGIGDMAGKSTSLRLNEDGLTEADCTEHAQPKARASDSGQDTDNSGRLHTSHPRYALNDLYCKMQKDTGAPDSFLGAVSQIKMLMCLAGKVEFDNTERAKTVSKDDFKACMSHLSEENQEEMTEGWEDGKTLEATITGITPDSDKFDIGDREGNWSALIKFSIDFFGDEIVLRILLRNDDEAVAMAVNDGSGREHNVDGFFASIDKVNKAVRFESMNQRIRTPNGTQSNGWNRHARIYVKGEFDDNLQFTSVTNVQGIYSDISNNAGSSAATSSEEPLQGGILWTANGSDDGGIVTKAYELKCTHSNNTNDCEDANLAASWEENAGSGACNGALSGTTCTETANAITTNAQTQFVMALDHADFKTTEDWFSSMPVMDWTELSFDMIQYK